MTTIKNLRTEERPREKLMERGAEALTDVELLAILLRNGTGGCSALDIGRKLLDVGGSGFRGVGNLSPEDLCRVPGMGTAKSATILAALEIGRRYASEPGNDSLQRIERPVNIYELMAPHLKNIPHEEMWVLFLNRANRLLGKEKLSMGGIQETSLDIRIIVKKALSRLATGVILVHNHPSGNIQPSRQDIAGTEALRAALDLMDIKLIDHIIIAGDNYYSFSNVNS